MAGLWLWADRSYALGGSVGPARLHVQTFKLFVWVPGLVGICPPGGASLARFKELCSIVPTLSTTARTHFMFSHCCLTYLKGASHPDRWLRRCPDRLGRIFERKTLSGGSLGSRVDEERSQLRELM